MTDTVRKPRGFLLLGIAAIAGIVAGTVAVYVSGSPGGNNAANAECAAAVAAAGRMAPLAKGELAAFQIATQPESFADLAFKNPDGTDTTLAALAGKTLLVNLWATWCVPCREEMPALDALQTEMGGAAFSVVAVNVDVTNGERARAFLDDIGVKNLAFYADPSLGVFNTLKGRGLAFGLPTTLLVDPKGCRLGVVAGPAVWDSDDAKALIRAAISES